MTNHTPETLAAFEQRIVRLFASGDLPFLIHLSGGNEEKLIEIFRDIKPGDWVFSTHRNHLHALLKGIPEARLEDLIKDGRSMFVYSKEHNFFTSAILAGNCAIAAGVALALKQSGSSARVFCFIGDGGSENGHCYEAIMFAEAQDLPCKFIIESNERQVDTGIEERRGARGKPTHEPFAAFSCVQQYTYKSTFPHGGAGLPPGTVTFKPEVVAKYAAP